MFRRVQPTLKRCFSTRFSGPSRMQSFLQKADAFFLTSVSRFHEITGYDAIEKLKHELSALDTKLEKQRLAVKQSRENYNLKLSQRSDSQREMNELLMRKSAWAPPDLERFTSLYKDDHASQQAVEQAKLEYDQAEEELEDTQLRAGSLMGARYREEQLFSDRIRQASTWGTWVLMGINILLFVLVTLVVEPYKRRKLVRAFEAKVREMQVSNEESNAATNSRISTHLQSNGRDDDDLGGNNDKINLMSGGSISWATISWAQLVDRLTQPFLAVRPIELGALVLGTYLISLTTTVLLVISCR